MNRNVQYYLITAITKDNEQNLIIKVGNKVTHKYTFCRDLYYLYTETPIGELIEFKMVEISEREKDGLKEKLPVISTQTLYKTIRSRT